MSRVFGRLLLVWLALLLLLAATYAAARLPLGPAKPFVGYAIATGKTGLILWFFMEMRRESAIARLATLAAAAWLIIMFALIGSDYLSRGWIGS